MSALWRVRKGTVLVREYLGFLLSDEWPDENFNSWLFPVCLSSFYSYDVVLVDVEEF